VSRLAPTCSAGDRLIARVVFAMHNQSSNLVDGLCILSYFTPSYLAFKSQSIVRVKFQQHEILTYCMHVILI